MRKLSRRTHPSPSAGSRRRSWPCSPARWFHGPSLNLHVSLLVLHHFRNQCFRAFLCLGCFDLSPGLGPSAAQVLESSFSNQPPPCHSVAAVPSVRGKAQSSEESTKPLAVASGSRAPRQATSARTPSEHLVQSPSLPFHTASSCLSHLAGTYPSV